jgi:hypothetical protein
MERLSESAANAGLLSVPSSNGFNFDPACTMCHDCSAAPDAHERLTALLVARALKPGGSK